MQGHQQKLAKERAKPFPDERLIAYWEEEIERFKTRKEGLTRRLKRDW